MILYLLGVIELGLNRCRPTTSHRYARRSRLDAVTHVEAYFCLTLVGPEAIRPLVWARLTAHGAFNSVVFGTAHHLLLQRYSQSEKG